MDVTHVVVKGDTLENIAQKYLNDRLKYKQLAALNNIPNPNRLSVGQKITIPNVSGGSSGSTPPSTFNSSKVVINQFGLQSNTDNTLFATWYWNRSYTESYQVMWYYDSGDDHWFVGIDSTVKYNESTYSIPSNAKRVAFIVRPISKTHTIDNKETSYWTASWSRACTYDVSQSPPKKPSTPTVTIDKFKLTAELDNLNVNDAPFILFHVIKNDSTVFKTSGLSSILAGHTSYSCTVAAGNEYKVRCRSFSHGSYSDWSDYSSNVGTIPATPKNIIQIKALSLTSVQLKFDKVMNSTSSEIEYTTKVMYFDSSNGAQSITVNSNQYAEITGLETGSEYFFRVRAKNDKGESGWSAIKSIKTGKPPTAPTTWSSSTTVITGEPLYLYWMHNAEDGSKQTLAQIDFHSNPGYSAIHNFNTPSSSEDEEEKPYYFSVPTKEYTSGSKITWRVRTAGITQEYGPWAVERVVTIYPPPTLELNMTDTDGNAIETLTAFPFYISGLAGPNTQEPIGYYVTIVSNDSYETVDEIGNKKYINKGDQVYNKYFDTKNDLSVTISANDVDLENNINYTLSCVVSMNSGLTAESSIDFTVAWSDMKYEPNAEISFDNDSFVTHIRPYCEESTIVYYKVSKSYNVYTKTTDKLGNVWGQLIKGATTKTGEQVDSGTTADDEYVYYCICEEKNTVDNVLLSVYRREFDGSFTELATELDNSKHTFITDPHPALDYARYRVVAITQSTGSVSYYDVPGYYVGVKAVIIQWNEEWTEFDTYTEDLAEERPWSGSLLKLPYNIDVSDSHSPDVNLAEYIGRKHPVSYYGTQLGETSSWSVEIPKDDVNTLYALRRLAIWMGDAYVREPSGSGYWANITVSFSQTHCETTIPVTLDITRVEGGA